MCEWFSCVVTKKGDTLFTETTSHEDVIRRAKLDDTKVPEKADFVRIEVFPSTVRPRMSTEYNLNVDIDSSLNWPRWFRENQCNRAIELAKKLHKAWSQVAALDQYNGPSFKKYTERCKRFKGYVPAK